MSRSTDVIATNTKKLYLRGSHGTVPEAWDG